MNYIIIENDPISMSYLQKLARRLRPQWNMKFSSGKAADTAEWLKQHGKDIQLAIMDIELDDGDCFDIFAHVRIECPIIFTTAYDEYVMRTFKLNNIDYLLKPIEPNALEDAFNKYERLERQSRQNMFETLITMRDVMHEDKEYIDRVLITVGETYHYVDVAEIAYFTSEDKYVYAITQDGKQHITSFKSLNDVEEGLHDNVFFRLSRDVITRISSVKKVSKYFKGRLSVEIVAGHDRRSVIVSAERRPVFLSWLGK